MLWRSGSKYLWMMFIGISITVVRPFRFICYSAVSLFIKCVDLFYGSFNNAADNFYI
jgi:hypothetical protein